MRVVIFFNVDEMGEEDRLCENTRIHILHACHHTLKTRGLPRGCLVMPPPFPATRVMSDVIENISCEVRYYQTLQISSLSSKMMVTTWRHCLILSHTPMRWASVRNQKQLGSHAVSPTWRKSLCAGQAVASLFYDPLVNPSIICIISVTAWQVIAIRFLPSSAHAQTLVSQVRGSSPLIYATRRKEVNGCW